MGMDTESGGLRGHSRARGREGRGDDALGSAGEWEAQLAECASLHDLNTPQSWRGARSECVFNRICKSLSVRVHVSFWVCSGFNDHHQTENHGKNIELKSLSHLHTPHLSHRRL